MAITEAFIAHHNSAGAFQIMLVQWVKVHVCNLNLNFYISSLLTPCSFFLNNVSIVLATVLVPVFTLYPCFLGWCAVCAWIPGVDVLACHDPPQP